MVCKVILCIVINFGISKAMTLMIITRASLQTNYTYNANGWMTALDAVHGQTTLLDLDYTYDYNSNIASPMVGQFDMSISLTGSDKLNS